MTAPYRWLRAAHKIAPNGAHFPIHRTIGQTARNGRDRSLQTCRKSAMFPFTFSLCFFSLPHPAAKRPQSRCDRFFPLVRQSSRSPCNAPHRRSFAFLRCSRYSRHAFATDIPCVRPVCKRPGSVSALCTASFLTLGQAARTEALRCLCAHSSFSPAVVSFWDGLLLSPPLI